MLYSRLLWESRKELPFECQHLRVCTTRAESFALSLLTHKVRQLSLSRPSRPIADRAPETDTGTTAHPHLAKRAWVGSFRKRRKASGWIGFYGAPAALKRASGGLYAFVTMVDTSVITGRLLSGAHRRPSTRMPPLVAWAAVEDRAPRHHDAVQPCLSCCSASPARQRTIDLTKEAEGARFSPCPRPMSSSAQQQQFDAGV